MSEYLACTITYMTYVCKIIVHIMEHTYTCSTQFSDQNKEKSSNNSQSGLFLIWYTEWMFTLKFWPKVLPGSSRTQSRICVQVCSLKPQAQPNVPVNMASGYWQILVVNLFYFFKKILHFLHPLYFYRGRFLLYKCWEKSITLLGLVWFYITLTYASYNLAIQIFMVFEKIHSLSLWLLLISTEEFIQSHPVLECIRIPLILKVSVLRNSRLWKSLQESFCLACILFSSQG